MQTYTIKTANGYFTTKDFRKAIKILKKELKEQKKKLLTLSSIKSS